jgi:PAS domain-containing protein
VIDHLPTDPGGRRQASREQYAHHPDSRRSCSRPRGIEDIYELTYIRKDGSRFPAVVSVTALRDAQGTVIGYLLIGTDNTARKLAEAALLKAGALQNAIFNSANFSSIATDAKGVIQIFNVGAERMLAMRRQRHEPHHPARSRPGNHHPGHGSSARQFATPIAPGFRSPHSRPPAVSRHLRATYSEGRVPLAVVS